MLYHKAIASKEVRFRWPDGQERIISIEVGAPILNEKNDWQCELNLSGNEDETTAMFGRDSLEALCYALYFLRLRIEAYRSKGVRILYLDCEEDVCLDALFPSGISDRNTEAQQTSDGNAVKPLGDERSP